MRRHLWLATSLTWLLAAGCSEDDDSQKSREPPPGYFDAAPPPLADGGFGCEPCTDCEESVAVTSFNHIDGTIDYSDVPPAGGDHHICWLAFDIYEEEVPDERWVHNLEHGGVVFLHNCPDGCDAELAGLRRLVWNRPQALLSPYAALPTRFAVVSWGQRLLTDCFEPGQFERFYLDHVDRARESVTGGPGCAQ